MSGANGSGHHLSPQAQFLMTEGRDVPRDVFPLPSFSKDVGGDIVGVSRSVKQRLKKRFHVATMVEDCIEALNALYSGQPLARAKSCSSVSAAQVQVHRHILNSVQKLGGPGALTGTEALQQLRAFDGYGDDQVPQAVKAYTPELLSLPEKGNQAQPLSDLLGSDGQKIVGEFIRSRLLSVDEARSRLAGCGVRHAYSDPRLRDPKIYRGFVRRLLDADLVELTTEPNKEIVEMFFVGKKDGRLRMVADCRRSNMWFAEPDRVTLTTAESLSRIELEPGSTLHISTADLKDAFYHFELPVQLRGYFGMRHCLAGDLGISKLHGVDITAGSRVYPRLKVLPMGWSHALWWCQNIHQRIVMEAGAFRETCLEDRSVAPAGTCMHLEYVDNFVVLGSCEQKVNALSAAGVTALREKGLVVHEEERAEGCIKVLGWQFDKTELRPLQHRVWRIRLAMERIVQTGVVTGRQLEKVIGHACFVSLGRRESLSIFGETYTFIQRFYYQPHRLWKSVRRELQIFIGVCPLIWRDLSIPWSGEVMSIDASNWGLGATMADFEVSEVRDLAKFSERWRFESEEFRNPRASTMGVAVASGSDEESAVQWAHQFRDTNKLQPLTVVPKKNQQDLFVPFPFQVLKKHWKVVGRYKWKRQEPIPVLEARAALHGIKHVLRRVDNFGKRHLVLSDSITAVCSLDRGRGKAFKMRRVTQQVGALCLATHTLFSYRWLPSEWNTADGPSRGSRFPTDVTSWKPDGDSSADRDWTKSETRQAEASEGTKASGAETGISETATGRGGQLAKRIGRGEVSSEVSGMLEQNPTRDGGEVECKNKGSHSGPYFEGNVGSNVSGRGRPQPSTIHGGCSLVPSSAPPSSKADDVASVEAVHSGLEETGPTKVKVASAVGMRLQDESIHVVKSDATRSLDDVDSFCHVPSAGRSGRSQSFRPCASHRKCREECSSLELGVASAGRGEAVEDSGIRRDSAIRPGLHQVCGKCNLPHHGLTPQTFNREDFLSEHSATSLQHVSGSKSMQFDESRRSSSISSSTWRRQQGLHHRNEEPARHSAERSVESSSKCATISERRPFVPTSQRSTQTSAGRRHVGRTKARKSRVYPALDPQLSLTCRVFIEIFSGCERLAKAVARVTGWMVLVWDISLGVDYDLMAPANRRKLLEWVRCGWVVGFHLGTPCESFSRARDVPPGPPPLRSDTMPLGLPDLSARDQAKVIVGNTLMRFTAAIMRLAVKFKIPCSLENPARSRLWLCPPIKFLLRQRCAMWSVTHFCGWGTAWKKATGFLSLHLDLHRVNAVQCKGSKRGICLFSGKPHVQLHGQAENGQWMTRLAQPYPLRLCNALAKCYYDWEVMTLATQFSKHL